MHPTFLPLSSALSLVEHQGASHGEFGAAPSGRNGVDVETLISMEGGVEGMAIGGRKKRSGEGNSMCNLYTLF